MKNKILIVGVIGVLMAAGLVLAGCEGEGCKGNGECVVTIAQGSSGLYIDSDAPKSSCGKITEGDKTGCQVADMIGGKPGRTVNQPKYGTHKCDC